MGRMASATDRNLRGLARTANRGLFTLKKGGVHLISLLLIDITLDSGINIGLRLLIFGIFSRGYFLIRKGNAYFFSKYPLFDGMGDAYFKG